MTTLDNLDLDVLSADAIVKTMLALAKQTSDAESVLRMTSRISLIGDDPAIAEADWQRAARIIARRCPFLDATALVAAARDEWDVSRG